MPISVVLFNFLVNFEFENQLVLRKFSDGLSKWELSATQCKEFREYGRFCN